MDGNDAGGGWSSHTMVSKCITGGCDEKAEVGTRNIIKLRLDQSEAIRDASVELATLTFSGFLIGRRTHSFHECEGVYLWV